MRRRISWAALLALMAGASTRGPAGVGTVGQARGERDLPPPIHQGPLSLEGALRQRRSVREFTREPLSERELSQLLWATQGVTDPRGYRTAPSAGALFPLEVYVATTAEVLHYDPRHHRVRPVGDGDVRAALQAAAFSQEVVGMAPAVFAITAAYGRTAAKYGSARGRRYAHLEAGHAAQNLLLQAVALGLGAVPIGAFDDSSVAQVLRLPDDREPLYLIPVGRPQRSSGPPGEQAWP